MDYGLIVDLETTGLNCEVDRIIELGFCEFGWQQGQTPVLLRTYGGLEDPGVPLTAQIQQLTGLSDAVLTGQKIDWQFVRSVWERASVIIAHNAQFDRGFILKRPELKDVTKRWACSVRHIDWDAKGFGSRKLQYLAADHGFINPFAHRAVFDCATTFRLVGPHLSELVANSFEPEYKVLALASPFESKDLLKANGYRWDADMRVWHKTVLAVNIAAERQFLAEKIYGGATRHAEEVIWFNAP